MRALTCALVTTWLVAIMGTMTFAADEAPKQPLPAAASGQQVVKLGERHNQTQLRTWIKSIKPSAGQPQKFRPGAEYWKQSVLRGGRGKMEE